MIIFLINKETSYSYEALLKDIHEATDYYPLYRTSNLYNYFLNLILAFITSQPLTLIDSDINDTEIGRLYNQKINVPTAIERITASSIDEILKYIWLSKSEISIFTSGTTGQPKKVVHTVQTLTRTVRISENYLDQTWGFAYNPTHMAGLQVFFQAVLNKNTIVNIFYQSRNIVYEAINNHSVTHISATPTFYRLLLPIENSFNSVKRITFGGEKSDKKLYDSILQIFPNAKINNIYASTEAGTLFVSKGEYFLIPEDITDKIKVDNYELLIHKSLLGKSNSFTFNEGFYRTGDLIEWINEKEGLFRFKSRKNELINIGGYKVNPSEVESVILQLPEVIQAVVFGRANSVLGNILCAEVKIKELSNLTEFDIRNYLSERLQDYKIPRKITFVVSFSITRTGKLKRL